MEDGVGVVDDVGSTSMDDADAGGGCESRAKSNSARDNSKAVGMTWLNRVRTWTSVFPTGQPDTI